MTGDIERNGMLLYLDHQEGVLAEASVAVTHNSAPIDSITLGSMEVRMTRAQTVMLISSLADAHPELIEEAIKDAQEVAHV